MTRTQRTLIVAAAVAAIVTAANASEGAYFSQSWGWVTLAFLVPTTVLLILDRVAVPGRLRIVFASSLGALAVWIALSTLWSISTSASVREVERVLVYVALALAVALVLRRGDGPGVFAGAFVGVTLISSYGLATRLFPDRFDAYDDPFNAYRLAEPLGYWNAFGLLTAIGTILAVGVVSHARRSWFALAAGAATPILVTAQYFAFSRGSWLALFFGLAATIALDARRITVLWSLLVIAPASVIAVAMASRQEALTTEDATTLAAADEGHRLALVLAALVPCSAALAWVAHRTARRVRLTPRIRRGIAVVVAGGVVAVSVIAVVTAGGPASAIDELRDRFEAPPEFGSSLNDRLFSLSGTGRAETITAAWDLGRDHPLAGTGAGTFEILWYENRPSTQVVRDAHSLYLETLNELGVVGLALLGATLLVPLIATIRARRTRFVAPACGAYLAWVTASGLDWHWEMVSLTTTALLVGSTGLLASERRPRGLLHPGSRLALFGVSATLSVLAVWSLVGNQALFAGREAVAREDWSDARDHARRAQALLVWSYEPELVLGNAYAGLGDRDGALRAYRDAIATDPRNWVAWFRLAQVARGAERSAAYDRVRRLNPREEGLPGG
jgi:O-antigen ligase